MLNIGSQYCIFQIRSCCPWPWPFFEILSTFGLAFHPFHAHLHVLLGQLVRSLWWMQPRSQGDFPGLWTWREKGGFGASCRSASATFFNSVDSVISKYETEATTRRIDRAWDIRDFGVRHMEHRNLICSMTLVTVNLAQCSLHRLAVLSNLNASAQSGQPWGTLSHMFQAPCGFGALYRGFSAFLTPSNCLREVVKTTILEQDPPNHKTVGGVCLQPPCLTSKDGVFIA